eukprot:TRINITY_DN1025_c0_g1_i8.p1 TRINITY_DN1025_c0_g1~~TRINITY_DN1025_c0_g1_i8.p1  ORF type:complete len:178 (+),score=39.10 TRINITY_DN1025_c0_g1_i8:73-606(+)
MCIRDRRRVHGENLKQIQELMEDTCSYKYISQSSDKCQYVIDNCEGFYINFHEVHYCHFSENYLLTLPLFIVVIVFLFYHLGCTAEEYLSTTIHKIVKRFNLSQDLAGVTFLAFGSAANDIIGSIVASSSGYDGIEFTIGGLLGAGSVSYTHLRAHETPEHLVCRLLLEKKKNLIPF